MWNNLAKEAAGLSFNDNISCDEFPVEESI